MQLLHGVKGGRSDPEKDIRVSLMSFSGSLMYATIIAIIAPVRVDSMPGKRSPYLDIVIKKAGFLPHCHHALIFFSGALTFAIKTVLVALASVEALPGRRSPVP